MEKSTVGQFIFKALDDAKKCQAKQQEESVKPKSSVAQNADVTMASNKRGAPDDDDVDIDLGRGREGIYEQLIKAGYDEARAGAQAATLTEIASELSMGASVIIKRRRV